MLSEGSAACFITYVSNAPSCQMLSPLKAADWGVIDRRCHFVCVLRSKESGSKGNHWLLVHSLTTSSCRCLGLGDKNTLKTCLHPFCFKVRSVCRLLSSDKSSIYVILVVHSSLKWSSLVPRGRSWTYERVIHHLCPKWPPGWVQDPEPLSDADVWRARERRHSSRREESQVHFYQLSESFQRSQTPLSCNTKTNIRWRDRGHS